jgi:hypothetical protein
MYTVTYMGSQSHVRQALMGEEGYYSQYLLLLVVKLECFNG